ncbi:asparagine synthetase B [Candidatus Woesearchaeota archaeon]|nr:asparagine synthetase B [Candidatus Woesearchaeota archaeon]
MCGIIGIIRKHPAVSGTHPVPSCIPFPSLSSAFKSQAHRGKDGYGIAVDNSVSYYDCTDKTAFSTAITTTENSTARSILLHNLHAVVNTVLQPLHDNNSFFLYNGEVYNWQELQQHEGIRARNDAELVFQLVMKKREACLPALRGGFAFALLDGDMLTLCRDRFGEKPLHYAENKEFFAFASEQKALAALGFTTDHSTGQQPASVPAGHCLRYDIGTAKTTIIPWHTLSLPAEINGKKQGIASRIASMLLDAVREQTEGIGPYGILFSGGIDSTILAWLSKQLKRTFTCYTIAYQDGNVSEAPDAMWARRAAEECQFPLSLQIVDDVKAEEAFKKTIAAIESTDAMKVGVAASFFLAGQAAAKDGIKVLLSGLGSEELFAGYERHQKAADINAECLVGLATMDERDLQRDDQALMASTIELRLPFLDQRLAAYALGIPGEYKITSEQKKVILREAAEQLGIPKEFCWRPKKAAQYGSGMDKAMARLAKKKAKTRVEYLEGLR